MSARPVISVVIPTFQRRESVVRAVRSLAKQTFDLPFEIVVAIDGSTDATAEALEQLNLAVPLLVHRQANMGAAAARDAGAALARGRILLFLDDDMVADPQLLAEHHRFHLLGADAVLGHMPLDPSSPATVISAAVGRWTNERLTRLSAPGASLGLHDLLTGQLSVSAKIFKSVDGFDPSFTREGAFGNEDVDFGYRLLQGGYVVRFNPRAISAQFYSVTPRQYLKQWHQGGRADVLFARKHPREAKTLFALNGAGSSFARHVARPISRMPFWRLLVGPARLIAYATRGVGGHKTWRYFDFVKALEYWRGVAEAGGVPRSTTLRVLAYHAVTDLRDDPVLAPYGVPLGQLRRHIAMLKSCGFQFVTPAEFASFAVGEGYLPKRAVLLTFDDCYADLLNALPLLRSEGITGIVFAVTSQIGGTNSWDANNGSRSLALAGLEEIQILRRSGFEIGGHSRTHPSLPGLGPSAVRSEIAGVVSDFKALGLPPPRFFAYPYGEADSVAREEVQTAGYMAGFTVEPGIMRTSTNRLLIPRIEVLEPDRQLRFFAKVFFPRQAAHTAAGMRRLMRLFRRYRLARPVSVRVVARRDQRPLDSGRRV